MPQRYFLDSINNKISSQDQHHIKKVMRMKIGDQIIVCNNGRCFLSKITSLDLDIDFEKIHELKKKDIIDVTIIQGFPKHPKNEFIAKYATMFGASKLIFVEMDRSISKLENQANKTNRLHLIAKEASELSHKFLVPTIELIKHLSQINLNSFDLVLLADELEVEFNLTKIDIKTLKNKRIAVIIGPEGGISENERKYLFSKNVKPVSLGTSILPTEAACLYILSHLAREID